MAPKEEPEVADALDGLVDATRWANNNGHDELAIELGKLYQEVGKKGIDG